MTRFVAAAAAAGALLAPVSAPAAATWRASAFLGWTAVSGPAGARGAASAGCDAGATLGGGFGAGVRALRIRTASAVVDPAMLAAWLEGGADAHGVNLRVLAAAGPALGRAATGASARGTAAELAGQLDVAVAPGLILSAELGYRLAKVPRLSLDLGGPTASLGARLGF